MTSWPHDLMASFYCNYLILDDVLPALCRTEETYLNSLPRHGILMILHASHMKPSLVTVDAGQVPEAEVAVPRSEAPKSLRII